MTAKNTHGGRRSGGGRKCTICNHERRAEIDRALAVGLSCAVVGRRYGASLDAIWRHRKHLSPELRAALALKLVKREGDTRAVLLEEGANVTQALAAVRAPLFGAYLRAIDCNDVRAIAALSGRLHESLSLTARLVGELTPHVQTSIVNIVLSPDYQRLRSELLRVLAAFPEARNAVAVVFRRAGEAAAAEMHRSVPRTLEIEGTVEVVDDAA